MLILVDDSELNYAAFDDKGSYLINIADDDMFFRIDKKSKIITHKGYEFTVKDWIERGLIFDNLQIDIVR